MLFIEAYISNQTYMLCFSLYFTLILIVLVVRQR